MTNMTKMTTKPTLIMIFYRLDDLNKAILFQILFSRKKL